MKIFAESSTDWQRIGETDPYWAVLTHEKFRTSRITAGARQEFFQSGEDHLDSVIQTIRDRIDASFSPSRALDFGCGVARVLIPLASRYPGAVGVDVSSSMLGEAEKNVIERGVIAELVLGDDTLTRVIGTFDFIHSYIVLQHIPPIRGEKIADRLLRKVRPGGVAALHFTYEVPMPRRQRFLRWARLRVPFIGKLWNVAKGRAPSSSFIEVYEYRVARILEIFRMAGCPEVHLRFMDHDGVLGVFVFGQRTGAADL
jgi:SAM-dependent methyltransferase